MRFWLLRVVAVVGCLGVAAVSVATPIAAAPPGGGQSVPTVGLSANEVEPQELIDVSISGFTSRTVTVTVCGNAALRGSGDCNMAASESTRVNEDGSPRYVRLIVSPPPTPCPCVIRVSSPTNDEAAVAPITLTGHPVADPVSGVEPSLPLIASIQARRATNGLADSIRASLGGPTAYDVTISIRNAATEAADDVTISANAGRREGHVLSVIDVAPPPLIAAGATWEETVRVELPAPVWGDVRWSVDVSGGDIAVGASDATSSFPVLLLVAVVVLLLVALALSIRLVARMRTRRKTGRPSTVSIEATESPAGSAVDGVAASDHAWADAREYESV